MNVDPSQFQSNVLQYLQSSAGKKKIEEFTCPLGLQLVLAAFVIPIALIMMLTVVKAASGFKLLRDIVVSLFTDDAKKLRNNPTELRPLITCGIIVGPQGHGLVLGSFVEETQADLAFLAHKAYVLGKLYGTGPTSPDEEPMFKLLRQDNYVPSRRRLVLEPLAEGRELYLFDMELKMGEAWVAPTGTKMFACLARRDSGSINQIPWQVVGNALSV